VKNFAGLVALTACILVIFSGCTSASQMTDETGAPTPNATNSPDADPTSTSSPNTNTTTASSPTFSPGSIALFATISGGSQSEFLRVEGGNVSWDTTHYKFLRYIPETQMLDEFGWTSSKSYSKTYIYGITAGDWVYVVKCFTDSGRKDITRLDPATGNQVGTFGVITTGDMYRGFTIYGDRIIYRTEVTKDLIGNRRGGGDVMVMELGASSAVEVLDYYDEDNQGRYYSIGDDLITVITTYEDDAIFYDIYQVNPMTFAVGELLYSFGSEEHINFYEGATSLFWAEPEPSTGNINIVRFPLDEYPVYYLEIWESTPMNMSVDESQGKVLISFRDNTPESPFYYLADIVTGDIVELEVDPAFFSNSIYGNGQFLILN